MLPWYIRQPSMPAKSLPMSRPASEAAGAETAVARRVVVEVVDAEEERIGVGHWNPNGNALDDHRR